MRTIIVVGAGINGAVTALELKERGHRVTLVDPGPLPHPLAASTDISKAVRSCYGADEDYTELAERAIVQWRQWNEQFGVELYHEVGAMFVRHGEMQPGDYEYESYRLLQKRRHKVERITSERLRERFPAWNADLFQDGVYDPEGGYAESGRVMIELLRQARSAGIELREEAAFHQLDENDNRVQGITLRDGGRLKADVVVMATGAWTPHLLPFTNRFFRSTGHPIFHLRPEDPTLFLPNCFPMFGADISTTGYYGFPVGREGVVKIGIHGPGREMLPESTERVVTRDEEEALRTFLSATFPTLAGAPIVHTRVCLYCDTHDGDFWFAADPDRPGLVVAAGDNGHGFKFAPVLGTIIADAIEEKDNPLLQKFRWRPEVQAGVEKEAARFIRMGNRRLI
jgi:glycine/D-amino acid oxidase-like deaminating enzyme